MDCGFGWLARRLADWTPAQLIRSSQTPLPTLSFPDPFRASCPRSPLAPLRSRPPSQPPSQPAAQPPRASPRYLTATPAPLPKYFAPLAPLASQLPLLLLGRPQVSLPPTSPPALEHPQAKRQAPTSPPLASANARQQDRIIASTRGHPQLLIHPRSQAAVEFASGDRGPELPPNYRTDATPNIAQPEPCHRSAAAW